MAFQFNPEGGVHARGFQQSQPGWDQLMGGDSMYGENTYGAGGRNNPFAMQSALMGNIYAAQGGNPYNIGQQYANNVNNSMRNWQSAQLLNAPQVTERMGIQQRGNNFNQLMSILPQLLGAIGGGILSPGEQNGFRTNYGASATLGGGQPAGGGLPGMLKQFH